ncbi:MAG: hypothetical protein DMF63_14775 [Acidobacteria bacterium]|nr:MAG: hypothetical protein DMF63_14775 [Acidobacteriota bacterium]
MFEVLRVKKAFLTILLIITAATTVAYAQIEQAERYKRRMDQSIKASAEREHDSRLEAEAALPVPKAAVTNVDVQAVFSKTDQKTFAAAKAAEAKKVLDGEPLWLYLKFKTKLGDYVLTTRNPDDREKLRYLLFAEIGPRGDVTALSQFTIQFSKEDLAATEFKIGLAPALFGRNKSIPVFLMASDSAKPGVWNNELRLSNTVAQPRPPTSTLSVVPVTLDFAGGVTKYKKLASEYDSIILRGTTDVSKLPFAGTFFSEPLKTAITEKLAAENITPVKVYVSGDDWQEFGSGGITTTKARKVFATFTYRSGESCMYGVAEVLQNYDFMESKYGAPQITIQKDLPAQCADVN